VFLTQSTNAVFTLQPNKKCMKLSLRTDGLCHFINLNEAYHLINLSTIISVLSRRQCGKRGCYSRSWRYSI